MLLGIEKKWWCPGGGYQAGIGAGGRIYEKRIERSRCILQIYIYIILIIIGS